MAFVTIVNSRFAVNAPASTDLFSDIVTDLNYLYTNQNAPSVAGAAPNVVNGSFELDAVNTIQPTGWIYTAGTGGSGYVTTSQYNDGSQSYQVNQGNVTGNTGGGVNGPYNQSNSTQQYYVVSPSKNYTFRFMMLCNRADIENSVSVNWYTNTQGFISATNIYFNATGAAPTTWLNWSATVVPPSNAYYCIINFNLGINGTTPPGATGNIWIDGVSICEYKPYQTGSTYTSGSNTFTVPSGVYVIKVSCYAASTTSNKGANGGTSIGFMTVIPGDSLTVSIPNTNPGGGANYYSVFVYNNRTTSVIAAQSGNNPSVVGPPTGGYLNVQACLINLASSYGNPGNSIYQALITLEY